MRKRASYCFILFTLLATLSKAQIEAEVTRVNVSSEIDVTIASAIAKDHLGYLWIATEEGLLRYDGLRADLYNEYKGLPATFSNRVNLVYVDDQGTIWATSDNQVAFYDEKSDTFHSTIFDRNISLIHDLYREGDRLYAATYYGLFVLNLSSNTVESHLLKGEITSVVKSYKGTIYLSTRDHIYTFSSDRKSINQFLKIALAEVLLFEHETFIIGTRDGHLSRWTYDGRKVKEIKLAKDTPIYDIIEDERRYIIGTDGAGVFFIDSDFHIINNFIENGNSAVSLSSNGVYDLLKDSPDQLWVATYGGGINKIELEGRPFSLLQHQSNNDQSISNDFTRAIIETVEGQIWYGTKEGISIFNSKSKSWKHIKSFTRGKKVGDIVMTLAEDGKYVWAGTYGNGAFKINKSDLSFVRFGPGEPANRRLSINKIYSIFVDKNDNVWLGGIGGPLHVVKNETIETLEVTQIKDIAQAPDGSILIAGRNGLTKVTNNKLEPIDTLKSGRGKLDYNTINCIQVEGDHIIWIGTNGDGLIKYNTHDNSYKVVNISNGLPSDIIQGIILDDNMVWTSTTKGIVSIINDDNILVNEIYNEADGLTNSSFNYGSYCKLLDGAICFGSTDGVFTFYPDKLNQNSALENLLIKELRILSPKGSNANSYFVSMDETQDVELKYEQNYFSIIFSAIEFRRPEKVKYSWRINEISPDWTIPSKDNYITLAGLTPGKYNFELKSFTGNIENEKMASLSFTILPPWWKSKWAYFLYTLLGLGALLGGFWITRALLKKKNTDEQISFYNNITHELKTPLSILLSKLEQASGSDNQVEIKSTIKRMNRLFDQLLNFNRISSDYYKNQKVSQISFQKNMDIVLTTFQQEIQRKELNVVFENHWPEEYFYYKRDALDKIFFNLVSNAIKYSNQKGSIWITASKSGQSLKLVVKDNGIGIPKDQQDDILKRYYRARNAINSQVTGTGLGLMIVKSLIENDKGSVNFTSEEGLGTAFTVLLPNMLDKYDKADTIIVARPIEKTSHEDRIISNKPSILIVEDNDELRIDMVEKLSVHYSIHAARNGEEGLEKAKTKMPDLIITDLIMPEMDGNELCRRLQKDEDTNHIPVFMMTVLNSNTQKVESIKSGISTYMTKPVDFDFLIAKINSTLEYKQKLREKYIHETEVDQAHKFKDDRDAEFIGRMEDFIISKIKEENISVSDLCKHMGMSRTALYMKLKEMIDMSLQLFIISTKMNHARKLLLQGGITIKEVAFQVGFTNPKYFSTSFKKQFGMSPSGFLKSLNPDL